MNKNTPDANVSVQGPATHPDPAEGYQDAALVERYDRVRFASGTGRYINEREQEFVRRVFASQSSSAIIVDVPCGTGRLAQPLLENGYRVLGVDVSQAMAQAATRKLQAYGDRFSTKVMDARELKELGIVFQGAVCARIFVHLPFDEQVSFLQAVAENTDGPIVITHSISTPWLRLRRFLKGLIGHNPLIARFPVTNTELKQLLAAAGLREKQRFNPIPVISEAIVVVAEKVAQHSAPDTIVDG